MSLSGDGLRVDVGEPYNGGNGTDSGHTRVLVWSDNESDWVQRGNDIDGEAAGDVYGR